MPRISVSVPVQGVFAIEGPDMLYPRHGQETSGDPKTPAQTSGKPAVPKARPASDSRLDALYRQVREILEQARVAAARSVNTGMVRAYWLIGRKVIEEEQQGSTRAGYGDELIDQLSARLRVDFGRGFNPSNLRYMRLLCHRYSPTSIGVGSLWAGRSWGTNSGWTLISSTMRTTVRHEGVKGRLSGASWNIMLRER
jgi:hypothetical protein